MNQLRLTSLTFASAFFAGELIWIDMDGAELRVS